MTGTSPTARFIPDKKLFHLSAGSTTLLLGINERNELQHLYFGGPLWRDDDLVEARSLPPHDGLDPGTTTTPEEYPAWGGLRFFEPCLKAALPDGTRDLTLQYASHTIDGAELTITLHDPGIQIQVALHYRLHPTGILRKHAVVTNHTQETITLESAQSGALHLPAHPHYRLSYLAGRWGGETLLTQEPIHPGIKLLESRRGFPSNQMNPWFAIDGPAPASETHGHVWFGAVAWSGSWRIAIEQTRQHQLRITAGYNPFDFSYPLAPGETLTTPYFYTGYTGQGFGDPASGFPSSSVMPITARAWARRNSSLS